MNKTVIGFTVSLLMSTNLIAQTSIGMSSETKDTFNASNSLLNTNIGVEQVLSTAVSQPKKNKEGEVSEMRQTALVEMASTYGTSAGLSWKLKKIVNEEIKAMEPRLDALYDFNRLYIEEGVLLPVIEEGQSNYAQNSSDEIRVSDKAFKIVSLARFVATTPTWRNYLSFSVPTFEEPPKSFLPKNPAEAAIWDENVRQGWDAGVRQGVNWYLASKDRLDRDYNGMIKSKQLIAQGVLTMTVVSKQNLGVTGGGKEMAINDQIFRIVDHSALVSNEKDWKVQYPITYKSGAIVK